MLGLWEKIFLILKIKLIELWLEKIYGKILYLMILVIKFLVIKNLFNCELIDLLVLN